MSCTVRSTGGVCAGLLPTQRRIEFAPAHRDDLGIVIDSARDARHCDSSFAYVQGRIWSYYFIRSGRVIVSMSLFFFTLLINPAAQPN